MKIILSQLRMTSATPTKTASSSFKKQLKHYDIQEKINNSKIKTLIRRIDQECRLSPTHNEQNECLDAYIQLQQEYDNVRRVKNLKHKLFLKHNLHWDEEYY